LPKKVSFVIFDVIISQRSDLMKKLIVLALLACAASALSEPVKIISVGSGDILAAQTESGEKVVIRLAGADAPETLQPFGSKAKEVLAEKIEGKTINLIERARTRTHRVIGDLYLEGRWINLEMIEEGLAWYDNTYTQNDTLAEAEKQARAEKTGLWSSEELPFNPKEFRLKMLRRD
jgi:endonuclease YncB( thermonuclease family)